MPAPMPLLARSWLGSSYILTYPAFNLLKMRVQYEATISGEFWCKVSARIPLAWADSAVAKLVVEVQMCIV